MAVAALDLNLAPQQLAARHLAFPENIRFSTSELEAIVRGGQIFGTIIALDVLEHVPAYAETIASLLGLLQPQGALIVSLPTESTLYRVGCRLAGREFTGDYHHAGAADIERTIRQLAPVDYASFQPVVMRLFRILRARME